MGVPRASRPPSGSWYTGTLNTQPWSVKTISSLWVLAMKMSWTESSSRVRMARFPKPPRRCSWYSVMLVRLMYPLMVIVTTCSSSAMRSRMDSSPEASVNRVRRGSAKRSRTSRSSVRMTSIRTSSEPRISRRRAMRFSSAAYSSSSSRRDWLVRLDKRIERMRSACTGERPKRLTRAICASAAFGDLRMISMTSSRLSSAMSKPSRMCLRSSALRRS